MAGTRGLDFDFNGNQVLFDLNHFDFDLFISRGIDGLISISMGNGRLDFNGWQRVQANGARPQVLDDTF